MESKNILPIKLRLTKYDITTRFVDVQIDASKFEELRNYVVNYERALNAIENDFHKWRLNKMKSFTKFFEWKRLAIGECPNFGRLEYNTLLDKLNKYCMYLPQSESFYEQQRAKKISEITV